MLLGANALGIRRLSAPGAIRTSGMTLAVGSRQTQRPGQGAAPRRVIDVCRTVTRMRRPVGQYTTSWTRIMRRRALLAVGATAVFSAPLLGEMLGFPERTLARSHLPKQPGEHDASVVLPGDPRFGAVTRGFNQRWIADPAYVRLCSGSADVVEAVESAVRAGLRITVRSGGHCYENFAYGNTGGVIVDLSLMNGVYVDAQTGWLVVDAGATLWDVYVQMYKQHGVTLPGGSCYSVGAGGHITGGGYGLLSR